MNPLLVYFIKVNIALVLFYLLYTLLFKRDTFLRIRRFYFLSAIVFSIVYPLLVVPGLSDIWSFKEREPRMVEAQVFIEEPTFEMIVEDSGVAASSINIPWEQVALVIYIAVTLFFIFRFLWQLLSILRIKLKSEKSVVAGIEVYKLKDDITPFSFFGLIFINFDMHSEKEIEQILIHEKTHVREKHSLDIILLESILLFSWWNPFVWLFKREMAMNLEYLADNGVLREGVDSRDYQYHLLRLTYHETAVQIVNNFNVSQLKQRIMMMNKSKTSTLKLAKYLLLMPMFFVLIAANSVYAGVNEQTHQAPPPPPPPPPPQPPVKIAETDEVFVVVEEQPEYSGGNAAMMKFLADNVRYPVEAHQKGVQGRVICNFVIEKDGSVSDVQIVRGVDPNLDAEAMRVIEAMPKWKPGMQKGEVVRTRFTLPIVFRLTGENNNQDKSDKSAVPTEDIFVVVEEQPEYPGGNAAMMKFLADNVRYPVIAKENGIQGRVICNFVVRKDGSITDVNVVRGVDPSIDAEAVRVIELMPKWKPGKQRGKEVDVRYTLPVVFRLNAPMDSDDDTSERGAKVIIDELMANPVEMSVTASIQEATAFPGGEDRFMKYMLENIKYPAIAQEKGVQGLVKTSLKYNNEWQIVSVKAIPDSKEESILSEEVYRVIKGALRDVVTTPEMKTENTFLISGKVKDDKSAPIHGASVVLKGTNMGTITDSNGNFQLKVPSNDGSVSISFVGYKTEELVINKLKSSNGEITIEIPVIFRLQGEGVKSYDGPRPENPVVVVGDGSQTSLMYKYPKRKN